MPNSEATNPEHAKLHAIKDQSQKLGEFIEWLHEQGMEICVCEQYDHNHEYFPIYKSIEQLLADYFEIDLDKLEEEKRSMIEQLRRANDGQQR